jgi:hypothetical protein
MEAHRLRVKDLVIDRGEVIVRDGKGGKDRVTVLPATLFAPIREHLGKLFARFERQRKLGEPGVSLPTALARKYPNAATQWSWQWVFPANSLCNGSQKSLGPVALGLYRRCRLPFCLKQISWRPRRLNVRARARSRSSRCTLQL